MLPVPSTVGTLTAAIGLLRRILAGAGAGAGRGDRLGSTVGAEKLLEAVCGVSSRGVPECARWACWWAHVGPWAEPRGRADLEMSLTASPSCASASGGFHVAFPPRPLPISPSSEAALGSSRAVGAARCPEDGGGGGSEPPSCSEQHSQPRAVPLPCCTLGAPEEAAAHSGVSSS